MDFRVNRNFISHTTCPVFWLIHVQQIPADLAKPRFHCRLRICRSWNAL